MIDYYENEVAVLGALMRNPEKVVTVSDILHFDHFLEERHQRIYKAILSCNITEPDLEMLRARVKRDIDTEYFVELTDLACMPSNIIFHAEQVVECSRQRNLLSMSKEIEKVVEGDESTNDMYADIEQLWHEIRSPHTKEIAPITETVQSITFDVGSYVQTGFDVIDNHMIGFGQGDMVVVAGRPGMGKTSLALAIMLKIARMGKTAGIFSLEITGEQLQKRLICSVAKVSEWAILRGFANPMQLRAVEDAKEELSTCGIIIDGSPRLTPEIMRSKILAMVHRYHISVVFIDYINLMTSSKNDKEYSILTEISKTIKSVARETRIPVVVLAQLNRDVEKRDNKRPRLSNLRGSGGIEQDADVVLFLYRDSYYNTENTDHTTELIIAKARQGKMGTLSLMFHGEYTSFEE